MSASMMLTMLIGCSGNQNEQEFLRTAPPGKPSEFPNESVAQRKDRTRAHSTGVAKGTATKSSTGQKNP